MPGSGAAITAAAACTTAAMTGESTGDAVAAGHFRIYLGAAAGAGKTMAGVTPAPGAAAIVRRAARIAELSHADLDIVYIANGTDGRGRDYWLARLRQVTSDVGASWHHLHAEDPATALIEFARDEQVTQIVLGASDRNPWQELASGGSIVRRITRLAARAGIDIHIVAPTRGQRPEQSAATAGSTSCRWVKADTRWV